MYHLNASSFGFLLHGNIAALIMIIFMPQFTYVLRQYCDTQPYCIYATIQLYYISICAISSVDTSKESCIGTVVNMSTLRIVESLDKWVSLWKEWAKCFSSFTVGSHIIIIVKIYIA